MLSSSKTVSRKSFDCMILDIGIVDLAERWFTWTERRRLRKHSLSDTKAKMADGYNGEFVFLRLSL
jgi:hypothetical protein